MAGAESMQRWTMSLPTRLPAIAYHDLIMKEMARRGYKVSPEWLDKNYRGKTCPPYQDLVEES